MFFFMKCSIFRLSMIIQERFAVFLIAFTTLSRLQILFRMFWKRMFLSHLETIRIWPLKKEKSLFLRIKAITLKLF